MAQEKRRRPEEIDEEFDRELDRELEEEISTDEELMESRVGRSGQWGDPTDPPLVEYSFEEISEMQEDPADEETLMGDIIDTAHSDGSTDNVQVAIDQGLVYTPPEDPPVVPSDDLQGAEVAAGFASSIEDEPEIANLPDYVDDNDEDAELDIRRELGYNSETSHLDDVRVYVRDGVAYLRGTVLDADDITIVETFVRDLDIVDEVRNELEVAD